MTTIAIMLYLGTESGIAFVVCNNAVPGVGASSFWRMEHSTDADWRITSCSTISS